MLHRTLVALAVGSLLFGCSSASSRGTPSPADPNASGRGGPDIPDGEKPTDATSVAVTRPATDAQAVATAQAALAGVASLDAAGFASRYGQTYVTGLGYDPKAAAGLDKIQASSMPLSAAALDTLGKNGFVISDRQFPTFTYGYQQAYADHLPLYVSADSILDAVHRSYDRILEQMELNVLIPELTTLLTNLNQALPGAPGIDDTAKKDADFFLAVAVSLLTGLPAAPVAGASAADVASFVSLAKAASGDQNITIFGVARDIDFSQFEPRGHYTDTAELGQYFRAMMWLGRIDFRLIETQSNGTQVFSRRQFDAMLALHSLFGADGLARHAAIDGVIQAFVGQSDSMRVEDVDGLLTALGAAANATTADLPDAKIAQTILDGGWGSQLISSDIMINGLAKAGTLPLNRSFLVFGQRFTIDSYVFSNVVFDRVQGGTVKRMMPSPLDVGFAALGNDEAGALLAPEIAKYHYAPDLASLRVLVDQHDDAFWGANLYDLWLSSLRALSPDPAVTADPTSAGLPSVIGTEPWNRRMLNAQLFSWAELRHDTILYVKQSYTGGASCEFPDAYVDPYPDLFANLVKFADYATNNVVPVADRAPDTSFKAELLDYFANLRTTAATLQTMAEYERSGTSFTADQMAFINQAVTIQEVCGGGTADGWYPKLVFGDPLNFDPTIADVHTEPTDETGADVGRVLHVGTGYAREIVVTTNSCTGPRAYMGLVGSYYEMITENYQRLTDEDWQALFTGLTGSPAPDVPWMTDLIAAQP